SVPSTNSIILHNLGLDYLSENKFNILSQETISVCNGGCNFERAAFGLHNSIGSPFHISICYPISINKLHYLYPKLSIFLGAQLGPRVVY
ncbi:hypothetical protein ACJX0J_014230, partial [Zea mays]